MNDCSAAIDVHGLTRRFGSFVAVDHVDLTVGEGEVFGFIGSNGAGKTTTIRMLCGVLEPDEGRGTVAGHDLRADPEAIKQNIGYMSQSFSLYDDLTVEENIDFYSGIYRIPRDRRRARKEWVLGMARLSDRARTRTAALPRGIKQRLALGCAVLHEPEVVFLDEPASGVDPRMRRSFWERIREMSDRGTSVFVTTHYMDEAEYCDRLSLIHRGRLLATDTPQGLRERPSRHRFFWIETGDSPASPGLLEDVEEVEQVAIQGDRLRVTVRSEPGVKARLIDRLQQTGVETPNCTDARPTLEDVFMELIESFDRGQHAP